MKSIPLVAINITRVRGVVRFLFKHYMAQNGFMSQMCCGRSAWVPPTMLVRAEFRFLRVSTRLTPLVSDQSTIR